MWHGPAYVVTLCLCVDIPHLNYQRVIVDAKGNHTNQQVSKVEEEGDDDRDEGPAGTEQDEVGGKNLICKTIKQRRSSRDYVRSKVMLTTTNRVQRVDNISADDPLASQDASEEEEQVLDVRLPSH